MCASDCDMSITPGGTRPRRSESAPRSALAPGRGQESGSTSRARAAWLSPALRSASAASARRSASRWKRWASASSSSARAFRRPASALRARASTRPWRWARARLRLADRASRTSSRITIATMTTIRAVLIRQVSSPGGPSGCTRTAAASLAPGAGSALAHVHERRRPMAPLDIETALDWRGRTVVDRDGDKIGTFDELYLDEDDRPTWGAVTTGLFGMRQTFVPLSEAQPEGDALRVPFDKDMVKDAPNVDPDTQLSADEEAALYRHYGLGGGGPQDAAGPE